MHFQRPRSLLLPACSASGHKDECFSGLALPHSRLSPLPSPGGAGSRWLHQAVQTALLLLGRRWNLALIVEVKQRHQREEVTANSVSTGLALSSNPRFLCAFAAQVANPFPPRPGCPPWQPGPVLGVLQGPTYPHGTSATTPEGAIHRGACTKMVLKTSSWLYQHFSPAGQWELGLESPKPLTIESIWFLGLRALLLTRDAFQIRAPFSFLKRPR